MYLGDDGHPCVQAVELFIPASGREVFATASPGGSLRTTLDLPAPDSARTLDCNLQRDGDTGTPGLSSDDVENAWDAESIPAEPPATFVGDPMPK